MQNPPTRATAADGADRHQARLPVRRLGIDTYQEPVVYLHAACPISRSEGFEARSRVLLVLGTRRVVATVNVVHSDFLAVCEAGLSEAAWIALGAHAGDTVALAHPDPVDSFSAVRAKIYGERFSAEQLHSIIRDIVAGRYSGLEVTAFLTACAGERMSMAETTALTQAMASIGARLSWSQSPVMDKHCVGGLPGNRTTPIVVAIVAACGLTIPKTSSRAITSPSGTADAMEVLAPVDLTLEHMRKVVEREGGCVVWGGAMALSPADDALIRVEHSLDFDSAGQLAASILSKKISAGSTHLIVDMPVGPTAKVRTAAAAARLASLLGTVGEAVGLKVEVLQTDGTQPVGRGIGPALEARDVLAVLHNQAAAPADLRARSVRLAGAILEFAGHCPASAGTALAESVLASGAALKKFLAICEAQGGLREPKPSAYQRVFLAPHAGRIGAFDNRLLAKAAKLAGAPGAPAAGLDLQVRLGDQIEAGQPCYTLHAETPGELEYSAGYLAEHPQAVVLEPRA